MSGEWQTCLGLHTCFEVDAIPVVELSMWRGEWSGRDLPEAIGSCDAEAKGDGEVEPEPLS